MIHLFPNTGEIITERHCQNQDTRTNTYGTWILKGQLKNRQWSCVLYRNSWPGNSELKVTSIRIETISLRFHSAKQLSFIAVWTAYLCHYIFWIRWSSNVLSSCIASTGNTATKKTIQIIIFEVYRCHPNDSIPLCKFAWDT